MVAGGDQPPQAGQGRPLPKKEADLFKNVVKHYESKQYKKALKAADAILKKFPTHGETLAMKGLTINYQNLSSSPAASAAQNDAKSAKREEAHSLVKQGLMYDMRSHVCWHVYGLLHRSDHNYAEAIKAYKQAIRLDADNLQILRDLSMLQIQMRDLDGFCKTRQNILSLKPNAKINWMAFALARHMSGDLKGAVHVIDIYLGTLTEGSAELGRCFESSELALYKNTILAEMNDNWAAALDHLSVSEGIVVDRGSWLWMSTFYRLQLRDFKGARQKCLTMFGRGMTENYRVHSLYQLSVLGLSAADFPGDNNIIAEVLKMKGTKTLVNLVQLTAEQKDKIRKAYEHELAKGIAAAAVASNNPSLAKSKAIQSIPLTLVDDPAELRASLDARCRRDLSRGVPSLFSELMSFLYSDGDGDATEGNVAARRIQPTDPVDIRKHPFFLAFCQMAEDYIANLEKYSKFGAEDEAEEPPSTIMWAWYLRCCLHEQAGELTQALELADRCLEHTPTAVDVYELKARILLASGCSDEASKCLDAGRDLDRQDRYMNNLSVRYFLKAGQEEEALKRIAMFTRHEGHAEQNLFDMQCSWYELELAETLAKKEEWGRSLKKYSAVVKHFDDFHEDQFDFHAYCFRKVTLRAYVSLLRFEDEVYGEEYYCRACSGMIRIYLHLHDHPTENNFSTATPDYSNMTAAERKKAKAVARKKKKAAEKRQATAKAEQTRRQQAATNKDENKSENGGNNNKKQQQSHVVDQDPLGEELLKKEPLEEARKYSAMMVMYAPRKLETWRMRYDVAIRRKKLLQAVQALHKAMKVDKADSGVFSRIVDFAVKVLATESDDSTKDATNNTVISEVIKEATLSLLGGKATVQEYVMATAQQVRCNPSAALPKRVAVAKALVDVCGQSETQNACQLIMYATTSEKDTKEMSSLTAARQVTVDTCRDALKVLKSFGDEGTDSTGKWISLVKEHFPRVQNME